MNDEIPERLDAVPNEEKIAKDWMPKAMLNFDAEELEDVKINLQDRSCVEILEKNPKFWMMWMHKGQTLAGSYPT